MEERQQAPQHQKRSKKNQPRRRHHHHDQVIGKTPREESQRVHTDQQQRQEEAQQPSPGRHGRLEREHAGDVAHGSPDTLDDRRPLTRPSHGVVQHAPSGDDARRPGDAPGLLGTDVAHLATGLRKPPEPGPVHHQVRLRPHSPLI